jgi:hypothetical protein
MDVFWENEINPNAIAQRLNDLGVSSEKNKLRQKTTIERILNNTPYKETLYVRRCDATDVKLNKYKDAADEAKEKSDPR